jgi:hypothetical protein
MPPNLTIYCLQEVTDYFGFERLCHDLLSLEGYASIEPLGGFSDRGRDAIHLDARSGRTTIFAYSVREDWRAKLAEDASKIKKHGHTCDRMVFLSTAQFSASERDQAVSDIHDTYGWQLDLYGAERLRILLDTQHPQIKLRHPSIFPPDFLTAEVRSDNSQRNHLFVSFSPQDHALADWLTRRLTAEGYQVWCERFRLLGGENYPQNVDEAIREHAFRVIALYSRASLREPEVMRQRNLALAISEERHSDFLIPLNIDGVTPNLLDRVTASLNFIPFEINWATGLRQLLKKLESVGCPKVLTSGKRAAVEVYVENDVLLERTEYLVTNCLEVLQIPDTIRLFTPQIKIPGIEWNQLQLRWANRRVNPYAFLSFCHPPRVTVDQYKLKSTAMFAWRNVAEIEGINSRNLVAELIRQSLETRCQEKGLQYCPQTRWHYFPPGLTKNNRLPYKLPTGVRNHVGTGGKRKYWQPSGTSYYKYSLAPAFWVAQDLFDDFVVLIRLRVRLTDANGQLMSKPRAVSRRKRLCKDWWNDNWLTRTLAICQYVAGGDKIVMGSRAEEQIVVSATPLVLNAPCGINESTLGELADARAGLLDRVTTDEDEDDLE